MNQEEGFEARIQSRLALGSTDKERLTSAILAWADQGALAEARALDSIAAAGEQLPSLAGLVVSVKANIDVVGWVSTAASRVLSGAPAASADAPLIAMLRKLGAIMLAQSNMTEFAYGALGQNATFGTPRNPLYSQEHRLPGGSTSGGAVAVAVGLVDVAVGTDTSGSVRIPAAFCGIAGFKPTQGRYSDVGIVPLTYSFDTPGFLSRSLSECLRIDRLLIDEGPELDLHHRRYAVPRRFVNENTDPAVLSKFDAALETLVQRGNDIREIDLDYLQTIGDVARLGGIVSAEAFDWHETLIAKQAQAYDPRIGPRIAAGTNIRAVDYLKAQRTLADLALRYRADMSNFDALLTPTAPIEPPLLSAIEADDEYLALNKRVIVFAEFANRINVPSVTIPIGGKAGIGLMATGKRAADRTLLMTGCELAKELEPLG